MERQNGDKKPFISSSAFDDTDRELDCINSSDKDDMSTVPPMPEDENP